MNRRRTTTTLVLALAIMMLGLFSPILGTTHMESLQGIDGDFVTTENSEYPIYSIGTLEQIQVIEYSTIYDALQAVNEGEADLFGHRIQAADYSILDGFTDVVRQWAHDKQQCWLSLNAKTYPLSSYHLRQAIAYAINKTEIAELSFNNQVDPVDLPIFLGDPLSVEREEGGQYYNSDVNAAQSVLGQGGMLDVDDDGYVEAPNGSDFSLKLTYPSDVQGLAAAAGIVHSNLHSVGINCTMESELNTIIQSGLEAHNLSYDMAITTVNFSMSNPQWGLTTFHSSRRSEIGENMAQISDGEINSAVFQYEDSFSLKARQTAVMDGMRVIRDRCPVIPLFNYRWLSVYSTANFDNWPDDWNGGAFGVWTPVKVTARPDSDNTLRVAVLPEYFTDFFKTPNPLDSSDTLDHDWAVMEQFNPYLLVYDAAVVLSPERKYVPRASTSWDVLYRGAISDIRPDQTRVRFYSDPNANWTDEVNLNSEDYRFTYNLLVNQSKVEYANLTAGLKTTGEFMAGITVDSLNPFYYRLYSQLPILPRHIWEPQNLSIWNPSIEDAVGSGPYIITEFTPGSSLTLVMNGGYYPLIDEEPPELNRFNQYPENPIPAERVVIRAYINDRSRIQNVTLEWTHRVGHLNFTSSAAMNETVFGYLGTIPSRITATSTEWVITATDIWGNTAEIASGYYERSTSEAQNDNYLVSAVALAVGFASVGIFLVLRRKQ